VARASTATSRLEDDWERFSAEEGSENEHLRLDALSSTGVPSQYGPVPERILAELDMGSGDDEARGHSGVDR
jgi:hypothetical protein